VGSALPLNGGTYTVLLNTTNKRVAAGLPLRAPFVDLTLTWHCEIE